VSSKYLTRSFIREYMLVQCPNGDLQSGCGAHEFVSTYCAQLSYSVCEVLPRLDGCCVSWAWEGGWQQAQSRQNEPAFIPSNCGCSSETRLSPKLIVQRQPISGGPPRTCDELSNLSRRTGNIFSWTGPDVTQVSKRDHPEWSASKPTERRLDCLNLDERRSMQ